MSCLSSVGGLFRMTHLVGVRNCICRTVVVCASADVYVHYFSVECYVCAKGQLVHEFREWLMQPVKFCLYIPSSPLPFSPLPSPPLPPPPSLSFILRQDRVHYSSLKRRNTRYQFLRRPSCRKVCSAATSGWCMCTLWWWAALS